MVKLKYRNTGFMRQVLIFFRGKYAGIEFNRLYFRIYKVTPEGELPRYRDLFRRRKIEGKDE